MAPRNDTVTVIFTLNKGRNFCNKYSFITLLRPHRLHEDFLPTFKVTCLRLAQSSGPRMVL